MKTLGIACCFFGTWPKWANLFLESCRYNSTIDFYLITDCAPARQTSTTNVKFVKLDLAGFNALASEKLGVKVNVKNPYKVTDFKPAYGVLFREHLEIYDFWGFCDLDVVFGNLRSFLTENLLNEYDVIATRSEFITGHFTLFRNIDRVNLLFKRSRDYAHVFRSEKYLAFDECGLGLHLRLLEGNAFADIASESPIDSFMHVAERSLDVRVHRKMLCGEYFPFKGIASIEEIRWEKGRVIDIASQKELMYYHLHELKRDPRFYVPSWEKMPEAFSITRRGIHWEGKEHLPRRLATAARRKLYPLRTLLSLNVRYFRRHLLRLLRAPSPGA